MNMTAACVASSVRSMRSSFARGTYGYRENVLALAAISEIATGVALLLAPPFVGQLLFGVEIFGVATTIARLAGIALVGLGVACWPGTPLLGMVTYSVAAALYLAYVGLSGGPSGMLLWPAVIAHVILGALLSRGLFLNRRSRGAPLNR